VATEIQPFTRTEVWRPVLSHPAYMVSSYGRVRSHHREEPLVLRLLDKSNGYLAVNLANGGVTTTRAVHVLVAEAFYGPRPDGYEVRHLNGRAHDNRAENVRWGTPSENEQDKLRHGTHPHASKTHCTSGHEFSAENTYFRRDGGRNCRRCAADGQIRRRMAKVALPADEAAQQLTTAGAR
jgi:hypothetical protein